MNVVDTDVLVIGAGGAGCQAAIAASDAGARVILLDKGRLGLSGGTFDPFTRDKGITVATAGFNPTDDPEPHYRQALEAARGLACPPLARLVAYEVPAHFRELLAAGAAFHPNRLPACFGGAMVGAYIRQRDLASFFRTQIAARPIRLIERTMATALLLADGRCCGAATVDRNGDGLPIRAGATILATGGASPVFRYNFTTPGLTGDGYLLALAAGAELTNLEFYQAILGTTGPARVYFPQWYLAGAPAFTDAQGRAFLAEYLPPGVDPERLVRERGAHGPFSASRPTRWLDIAVDAEIRAGRGTAAFDDRRRLAGVYCHFASLPAAQRAELDEGSARPSLRWLKARGVEIEAGPVPVAPFAHAFNGGVAIDEHGATGVPGLYACGEVASGPHGANRVGGHMFAVLLVFGMRAGRAAASAATSPPRPLSWQERGRAAPSPSQGGGRGSSAVIAVIRPHVLRSAIQRAMAPIMIAKDADSLAETLRGLAAIRADLLPRLAPATPHEVIEAQGVANLLEIADLVARSASLRRETRGPHYRVDAPEEDPAFERNLVWARAADGEATSRWGRPEVWRVMP
jgi:succinate dehydrogenase/fumarate reductase flavoprotein subunit